MTTIVTRAGKGSPLTHTEVDTNFTNLNTAKLETAAIPLGTLAAPSISFTGDANTGVYSPGADTLAFVTAGQNRLHITSGGLLGLGTSAPSELLTVNGTTPAALIRTSSATGNAQVKFNADDTNYAGVGLENTSLVLRCSNSSTPTSRVTITNGGLVGIGTTAPSQLLEIKGANARLAVNSTTVADGGILLQGNGTTYAEIKLDASSGILDIAEKQAAGNITFSTGTTPTERVRVDSSGRLLVGTSSSTANARAVIQGRTASATDQGVLYIQRGSSGPGVVSDGSGIGEIWFADSNGFAAANIMCLADNAWGGGGNDYPGRLVFSTTADGSASPTERMRITNDGFFKATSTGSYHSAAGAGHELITATNASYLLYGKNTATTGNVYGYQIFFSGQSPNNTTSNFFHAEDTTALRAEIRSNGGLANYSANNANLSDRNAKQDISPAADTWDCIKEWEIVNFRYKDQPNDADLSLGVIAQQVAESCPEVITIFQEAKDATEDKPAQEERLGVKEQQMMWMAIKALQEAMERIETLEASNADILARLSALEAA